MKKFDFKEGDELRLFPMNTDMLWDLKSVYYLPIEHAKYLPCISGNIYTPGKCPICDALFEELYLAEYNEAMLWV